MSCADNPLSPDRPTASAESQAFVRSQHLPLLHFTEQYFGQGDIEVFHAVYGHPYDCLAGCAYSSAVGLRRGRKVGWLDFHDDEGYEPDSTQFFDVTAEDSVLFRESRWSAIEATERSQRWFWSAFLPRLARDPDTDPEALLRLARMLYSYISRHVAWELLGNPVVQRDREVLRVLAALPVFRGDAYELPRERARELLDGLPPGVPARGTARRGRAAPPALRGTARGTGAERAAAPEERR